MEYKRIVTAVLVAMGLMASVNVLCQADSTKTETGWTMQSCVDFAMENNSEVHLNKIDRKISDVELKQAKGLWLPTLSFGTNQSYGNRPYGDPVNSYSGSYNLSASWTVFDGSRKSSIDEAKLQMLSSEEQLRLTQATVTENVMNAYIQILYSDESKKIQRNQLNTLQAQRDRSE